ALLYFAFASGCRCQRSRGSRPARFARAPGRRLCLRLEHSKTQQAGVTASSTPDKSVVGVAAEALTAWFSASEFHEGAIFRRLWKTRLGPASCRRHHPVACGFGGA